MNVVCQGAYILSITWGGRGKVHWGMFILFYCPQLGQLSNQFAIVLSKVVSSAKIKWTAKHPPNAARYHPVFHQCI